MREIKLICDKGGCNKKAVVRVRIKSDKINKSDKIKTFSRNYGVFCLKHSQEFALCEEGSE